MRALVPCARGHAAAGEVDAKLEETSTVPCQCVITQPIFFTDHFVFADSMPHHARARPALGGHAHRRWRSGCEVGRDDLQVFSFALYRSFPIRNYSANFFHRSFCLCRFHATPCARSSRARRTCRRWRSGCGVGRDDLQVFSFALHRSVPMRNYSADFFHRSFCLCRFHATPCARSAHASARADMHAAAVQPPLCSRRHISLYLF